MKLRVVVVAMVSCGRTEGGASVSIPTASVSSSAAPVTPSASVTVPVATDVTQPVVKVTLDTPMHFKDGGRGRVGDVTFRVRMLPKLIVSGPQPEIEQAEITVDRGTDHAVLHVDTRQPTATFAPAGLIFELGYADPYHDDVMLTVRKK